MAKTPFAHLLLYLQARKLSGTLAIWPEPNGGKSGQERILFQDGELVAMRPTETAKTLYAALMPMFTRQEAPYGFYEGHNLLGQSGFLQEPVDIQTLLSRGLRVHVQDTVMDSVLERVRGRTLRMRPGASLDRLELNPRELTLIEPLRQGGATLESLLASGVLGARDAKRALYLLTLVRAVEANEGRGSIPALEIDSFPPQQDNDGKLTRGTLGDAAGPLDRRSTAAPPRPTLNPPRANVSRSSVAEDPTPIEPANQNDRAPSAPPAPLGLSPADDARWNELAKVYHALDATHHYDLLQLPKTATAQELENAYYALVKKFHPDRLPLALAPLLRAAQVLFDRLTEAHGTLSNPKTRAEYDKAIAGGGGTRAAEREMRNVLEAALEYQKAEVLVRRREYGEATTLLRSAIQKSPNDADSHALFGWILHLTNPSTPAPLDEMLRALDRALKVNPEHERAHYYRGVVLKRLNRNAEAVRHFKKAAELNPHNVDAAREVRLAVMRRESNKPPAPPQNNVLSRLFKK